MAYVFGTTFVCDSMDNAKKVPIVLSPFKQPTVQKIEIQQKKNKLNIFILQNIEKTNGTMQKYCRRGFIWMVTP